MRRLLVIAAVVALGFALSTPAVAGSRDHWRGHDVRVGRGGYHGCTYAPVRRPRYHSSFFFGFGGGFYGSPFVVPVLVPPPPPVWIPAHYVYTDGPRIFVAGYWSR